MSIDADEEYDPLAPPSFSSETEPFDDDGDGGFSDQDRVVRVWIEDGRLSKVRLSPVWFQKVPDTAALETRFRQALMLASVRLADGGTVDLHAPVATDVDREFHRLPQLNKRSLAAFQVLSQEQRERFNDAATERRPQPPAEPAAGRSKGVTVTLNDAGYPDRVTFDPDWLDDAQVGTICAHVMIAADRANARFVPAAPAPSQLDDIRAEREMLRAAYQALLTPQRDSHE